MKKQLHSLGVLATTALLSISYSVSADEKIDQLCAKMKQCALAQVDSQGLPPQVRETMVNLFDSQCVAMTKQYSVSINEAGLKDESYACIDSITEQSCDQIVGSQGQVKTPECEEFEKAAEAAEVDLEKPS